MLDSIEPHLATAMTITEEICSSETNDQVIKQKGAHGLLRAY